MDDLFLDDLFLRSALKDVILDYAMKLVSLVVSDSNEKVNDVLIEFTPTPKKISAIITVDNKKLDDSVRIRDARTLVNLAKLYAALAFDSLPDSETIERGNVRVIIKMNKTHVCECRVQKIFVGSSLEQLYKILDNRGELCGKSNSCNCKEISISDVRKMVLGKGCS